ncbi:MAG: hypothetical protein IJ455_05520 [Agathobacter sp.]|nr:hypothetical protein [Agathobacter sp.]
MSNLLKQQYVINLGSETRIINGDDRYKPEGVKSSLGGAILPEGITGSSIPTSEEIIDGFLAGLEVEEVQVVPEITPEEILEQARAEADGILVAARLEAEKMTDDAKMQAELLFEQKKQQGYQEGVSKLQDEVLEHRAKLQEEFDEKKQILQAEYEAKLDTLEADMVDVMVRVFHKVFNVQFDNKKQILLHLIKDTLLGIDAGKNFIIRVAEGNYKFIESHVTDIKEKIGNDVSIDVVNDMNLEENDCIIETPTGVYNCGIDMVLSNLEKDIKSLCR